MRFDTPEYSQFLDVDDEEWRDKCSGILSLKMLLDFWSGQSDISPEDVEDLISEALEINAYIPDVGWKHKELVEVAQNHGLGGENFDWVGEHPDVAFNRVIPHLSEHPIMVSIRKDLVKDNPGRLVVLTGYEDGKIFYNDPDAKTRGDIKRNAPLQKFLDGWKHKIVVIHPDECTCSL